MVRPSRRRIEGDLPIAQFLWTFGKFHADPSSIPDVLEKEGLLNRFESWHEDWSVNGWIGTAHQPKQLDNKDAGNLNGIVVFARGRLFHENILEKLTTVACTPSI